MTTTTEPTPTREEADAARRKLATLSNSLVNARQKAADALKARSATLVIRDNPATISEAATLESRHTHYAAEANALETEAAGLQQVVHAFDQREAARVRTEQAEQRKRDVARAAELAGLRIGVAGQIDVKLAELAALAARFDALGFDLAVLEPVTGISSQHLNREGNLRGAVLATANTRLAKTFGAMRFADGDAPLAATQRELLSRITPTSAVAAE